MAGRNELFERARRQLSREEGALRKEAPRRVALCYPSPYFVGMSSLGFQTIYREINLKEGWSAERCFLPEELEEHRKSRTPLLALESQSPLTAFPLVAFSVAYELELPGLFAMLELAGLPVLASQRNESHPLVVVGGPLTFSNPDPLEPFIDVLVQGEAEVLIGDLLDAVEQATSREELLTKLAVTPGFRVPHRSPEGTRHFVAKAPDSALPARSQVITPDTELRSMFLIEPERGCSRGCHYCVMRRSTNGGMRALPLEQVLELVPAAARKVGLVGAAVTDHPRIAELIEALVASGRQVGISSLRADRLSARLTKALRAGGARVLTVAADGASQRLRDLIDRRHTEEQLLAAAKLGREARMERLKLYCMVGLPHESEEDIDELSRLSAELSQILPLSLGVAPFVAKRQTPLDGAPFAGVEVVEERLLRLRRGLRGKAEVRPTSARWAFVEYMLAQCGPDAGLAAYDAYRAGGSHSAWRRAFEERGVRPYLARRVEDGRRTPTSWPTVESPVS
ncbi:MAG: radical SAM protein [Myxococcales bacterium]|nr:radical SAM protein [Myxococcales bacterium]